MKMISRLTATARHLAKRLVFSQLPERMQEEIDFHFYLRRLRAGTQAPESELRLLHLFAEPGTVALDVGANLGAYAFALGDAVGADGAVHAFEPVPRSFRLLERSATRLGKTVHLHRTAVSSRDGNAVFYVPLEGALGNFYVASLLRPMASTMELPVTLTTLDAWRKTHPGGRVSFIKIDVEGVEFDALSGARELITHERPIVLCEISGGPEYPIGRDPFELMRSLDYASFQHVDGRLVAKPNATDQEGPNFVFIPLARVERFRELTA